jgi:chromate reductase
MTTKAYRVLGIAGSLRHGSTNRALLREAVALAPAGMTIVTHDIATIPPYNYDVQAAGYPAEVSALREAIAAADGLLIVSPEYNYSIPGVLKNAIDWASRPPSQPCNDKPLAIMGVSSGNGGTMRMQYHLRQVAVFLNMHTLNKPEVFVNRSAEKFDAEGRLTDESTRKVVTDCLAAFADWIDRLKK